MDQVLIVTYVCSRSVHRHFERDFWQTTLHLFKLFLMRAKESIEITLIVENTIKA